MNQNILKYCLTDEERLFFNKNGFLMLRNVLDVEKIESLIKAVDEVYKQKENENLNDKGIYSSTNFMESNSAFVDLISEEKILPKIWGILGWNIYLYHAHIGINFKSTDTALTEKAWRRWHQDSKTVNDDIECHPRPRLSIKTIYFLSNCHQEKMGNTWIVPGSHLNDDIKINEITGDPAGATPVCGKKGDVIIIDRRLWHTRSINSSNTPRKALFYGYSYRWLQKKDDFQAEGLIKKASPILKQLLGYHEDKNSLYDPTNKNVPLKVWLEESNAMDTLPKKKNSQKSYSPI